ncbi:MAG: hypothetical protein AAF958_08400 [Planctomycetota bacterium]
MNRTVIPRNMQRPKGPLALSIRSRGRSLARFTLGLFLATGTCHGVDSIALGQVAAPKNTGQFVPPKNTGQFVPPKNTATPPVARPTVHQLETMMSGGDLAGAVEHFRRLSVTEGLSKADLTKMSAIYKRLVNIGIDAKLLTLAPETAKPLPKISGSGDLAQTGISPLVGDEPSSGVVQASGMSQPGVIGQAGGLPSWARNKGQNGDQVRPVQFVQGTPTIDAAGQDAAADFEKGMQALASGDKAAARESFLQAWKNQETLDPNQRNMLKDKLTLLQPRRLAPTPVDSDAPESPLDAAAAAEQAKTRQLYREVTSEMAKIEQGKTEDPMQARADLESLRDRVEAANVAEDSKNALVRMVDRSISRQSQYIEANRADIELDLENQSTKMELSMRAKRREQIDAEVKSLVEEYNELREQQRFEEAQVLAKQVAALKPNSTIATTMNETGRLQTILQIAEETEQAQRDGFIATMEGLEKSAIPFDADKAPLQFADPRTWTEITELRSRDRVNDGMSAAERAIQEKMSLVVPVKYRNRPLGEVLDDLSAVTGIPIVPDLRAMGAVRVNVDTPVTLDLNQPVPLKSALNLILDELELAYMIKNDVLMVTSEGERRNNLITRTYRVADLVTPIPNFTAGYEDGLAGAIKAAYQMSMPQADVQMMPVSLTDMHGGGLASRMKPGAHTPNVLGQYGPMSAAGGFGGGMSASGRGAGGQSFADFQPLMELIETTIEPDAWETLGGKSTMSQYAQNLSLVISTTSDVHDQILDLLESLRRLQNLQITIEVRFITLSDSFAENIGVDFDIQFDDNLTDFPSDDAGPSVSVGIDADGAFTPDLDIQFNNALATAPPFGAPLSNPSSIGFAILSDIEAFFFLQATQADNRSNVMQAPKVTMFDGQIASINDQTQRPFVVSITPVVGDFAVAQQPVIVVLNEGTQLNVQGIVSDDKRFVRLTLVPFFSQIGDVDTFTYEGRRSTNRSSRDEEDTNGDGQIDEDDAVDTTNESDVIEGTTVQLPTFAFTTVSTTVSVPDGGTILLGGVKRLAEGRSENGVPMLSKIPYINRLFRNQAIGRDARSLMLMVTPRIIIQEEEELSQTGFNPENR